MAFYLLNAFHFTTLGYIILSGLKGNDLDKTLLQKNPKILALVL